MLVSGQLNDQAAFTPGEKALEPTCQEAGWARAGLEAVEKIKSLIPAGN
jgi:hypothetical protein